MTIVNIYDAKTQLSKLIEEAAAGHDVVIARGGKPVARLTRLVSSKRDAPLPSEVLRQIEGP
jgi:prevent-host-death family protein